MSGKFNRKPLRNVFPAGASSRDKQTAESYCKVCNIPQSAEEKPFFGGYCRDCWNAYRRERYRFDPEFRRRSIDAVMRSRDPEKHNAANRRYRARLKARKNEEESS